MPETEAEYAFEAMMSNAVRAPGWWSTPRRKVQAVTPFGGWLKRPANITLAFGSAWWITV